MLPVLTLMSMFSCMQKPIQNRWTDWWVSICLMLNGMCQLPTLPSTININYYCWAAGFKKTRGAINRMMQITAAWPLAPFGHHLCQIEFCGELAEGNSWHSEPSAKRTLQRMRWVNVMDSFALNWLLNYHPFETCNTISSITKLLCAKTDQISIYEQYTGSFLVENSWSHALISD